MMKNDDNYGMDVLQAGSLRRLVEQVNDLGLMKEDIVQILKEGGTFFLLYYK